MALGSFRPFQFRLAKWGWAGAALAFDVFPNGFEGEQPMSRMDFGRLQKKTLPWRRHPQKWLGREWKQGASLTVACTPA